MVSLGGDAIAGLGAVPLRQKTSFSDAQLGFSCMRHERLCARHLRREGRLDVRALVVVRQELLAVKREEMP